MKNLKYAILDCSTRCIVSTHRTARGAGRAARKVQHPAFLVRTVGYRSDYSADYTEAEHTDYLRGLGFFFESADR